MTKATTDRRFISTRTLNKSKSSFTRDYSRRANPLLQCQEKGPPNHPKRVTWTWRFWA